MTAPTRWLALVCFMSGAAGLVFEMVWFHRSGLVFGNSVWSTTLVLSSFMAGLTLGSALVARHGPRARHFFRAYALCELVVAVSGVALTYALPGLTRVMVALTGPGGESMWTTNLARFIAAFFVLLTPATAMGATLPLLTAALARGPLGFGPALGHLYGWNTLGAVAGVVGAELWLVDRFGVEGAAWGAAMLGLGAAAVALRLSLGIADADAASPPAAPPHVLNPSLAPSREAIQIRRGPILLCSFLSGATLLALEVVWFRFLTMYVLSTTLAASLMLAVVLAGIGAGGLVASLWLRTARPARALVPVVACATSGALVGSYVAFGTLTTGTQIASWPAILWLAVTLTGATSLLSGVLFTLLGDTLQQTMVVETRSAGWLLLTNTAGGMCGPVVAAFVLLPLIGMEGAFFTLAAVYVVIAGLALGGLRERLRIQRMQAAFVVATALALVWFPFGRMERVYFARVVEPYMLDGSEIVATREGPSETIFLMQQRWMGEPVYTRLVTNGFSMSGTASMSRRYMRAFVYWPLAVHQGPIERVLVICYGVGVTADAALDLPDVKSVDVVEISRDIVEISDAIYPTDHPLRDARTRLHIEDGRQFLETTMERFDLITGEPPPPRTPGAVNIYTREFFALAHDRLAEGGIATYWLPIGRPDPGTNVNPIIRAFCDVFDDCSLWTATPYDLMLVGTRGDAGPASVPDFVKPWGLPGLRESLSEVGLELPQQLGATFVGDAGYLRQLAGDTPPLVDAYPHRLRPILGKPSLSDPGYGVDPAVTALYQTVLDPARARDAFASSDYIRRLWPTSLIDVTLPFFDHQETLNQVFWEGGRPLRHIEHLHRLLTRTSLRTLPLWVLGSDAVTQGIARRHANGSGASEYARALSALVDREYAEAADAFARAERQGVTDETLLPLHAYARYLAGQQDAAVSLLDRARPQSDDERHFWQWLRERITVTAE